MHSWKRSCTGCTPRPGTLPGASDSMHCTGQNSGHLPHGKQRLTSMNATSRGRFFFSPASSATSGRRSSLRRLRMTSMAATARPLARWPPHGTPFHQREACHGAGDPLASDSSMALEFDRTILGEEFDRSEEQVVTADELIAFARSLGETTPCYVEPGPDLIGHPTFCIRFR